MQIKGKRFWTLLAPLTSTVRSCCWCREIHNEICLKCWQSGNYMVSSNTKLVRTLFYLLNPLRFMYLFIYSQIYPTNIYWVPTVPGSMHSSGFQNVFSKLGSEIDQIDHIWLQVTENPVKGGVSPKENSKVGYFIASAMLVERTQVHLSALLLAAGWSIQGGLLTPGSQGVYCSSKCHMKTTMSSMEKHVFI